MAPDAPRAEAKQLAGMLAEPTRAGVWAALVLGRDTVEAVAELTGLTERDAEKALRQLQRSGLASHDAAGEGTVAGRWSADLSALRDAADGRTHDPAADEPDATRATVLRSILGNDGRVREMPVQGPRRRVLLEHIARRFEPGERYPEPRVNEVLHDFHDDHAALRRYLVEDDLLARGEGFYWRAGGPVEV